MATRTASDPSKIRYQAPNWAIVCWITVKMAVPTIGPSILPTPPIRATKIIFADHPTLKIALARTLSWLMISSAPPAAHPDADTTYTTQVPIAKYYARRRKTRKDTGTAIAAATTTANGIAR